MRRENRPWPFLAKTKNDISQSGPSTIRLNRKRNYLGTDIGLNIPGSLHKEVMCGSRIDPEAKLILEHNYACKRANLIDPRLDKTHCLLENIHLIWIGLQKRLYDSYNTGSTCHYVYECHTEILHILPLRKLLARSSELGIK